MIRSSWPGLLETGALGSPPAALRGSALGREGRLKRPPGPGLGIFFISGELEDEVEEARRRRSGDSVKGSPFVACEYPVRP